MVSHTVMVLPPSVVVSQRPSCVSCIHMCASHMQRGRQAAAAATAVVAVGGRGQGGDEMAAQLATISMHSLYPATQLLTAQLVQDR